MKKAAALLLTLALLLTAAGCVEKEYYYEIPASTGTDTEPGETVDIRNYSMLKSALTNLIAHHAERGRVRFVDFTGSPGEALPEAILDVRSNTPLGAYAVDSMSFHLSYVVSYYVADLTISYLRSVEELQSIVYALSEEDLSDSLRTAVSEYVPHLTIRLYSTAVNEDSIRNLIKNDYYDDPVSVSTEPHVTVKAYPSEGPNRLYDISLTYDAAASAAQQMTLEMQELLEKAAEKLRDETPARAALDAAAWLNSLKSDETDADRDEATAYGALLGGSKDSKGLALAYRAICAELDIPCMVVEGSKGSLGVDSHYWNIIGLNGDYYHVDVSAFSRSPSLAFLRRDSDLWGEYIWTAADYPACTGSLSFAVVVGIVAAPNGTAGE